MLSTGKICEDIAKVAKDFGWDTYIAYGRWARPGVNKSKRIGNNIDMYMHYFQHRVFDREGLSSVAATKGLLNWIEEIKPDIIQLHNIHDHYINYPILFNFLDTLDIPIIWTQHDCWAYTGGCMYHDLYHCNQWRNGCLGICPNKRALLCDFSGKQFKKKQIVFSNVKKLIIVTVSYWLNDLFKQTYHSNRKSYVIHNGIDLEIFRPLPLRKDKYFSILGVAAVWDERKGLSDFVKLRKLLPENFKIILIGLTKKQIKCMPDGINAITRTSNIEELVRLYSDADVFVNPTYSDNFPTTNLEALACGTPVITYRTGGSHEAVDENTGAVVEQGDLIALCAKITEFYTQGFKKIHSEDCRNRAEQLFDKDKCFHKYIHLYESLLNI